MLKFEPRFNVSVLALASRQKDSIESNNPGNRARVSFTVVIEINPHRTTLNKSNYRQLIQAGNCNSMPKRTWR